MQRLHKPIYERRIEVLSELILSNLRIADRVLDVGCGSGALGRAILDHAKKKPELSVRGLERNPRGGEKIEVDALTGDRFPYEDDSFDVVTVLDVLHHDEDPDRVLAECVRVSKRLVIVKDHKPEGLLAQSRISLLDWAANRPYGVKCLYRYPTLEGWHKAFARAGMTITKEITTMELYPKGWNWFFAGPLHYFAVLRVPGAAA
jgi:SAM-dependent methyltransferase